MVLREHYKEDKYCNDGILNLKYRNLYDLELLFLSIEPTGTFYFF